MKSKNIEKEVEEMVCRNFGQVDDTIFVIDQMISIYSMLKVDKPVNRAHAYESLAADLLDLKIELQKQKVEYNRQNAKGANPVQDLRAIYNKEV